MRHQRSSNSRATADRRSSDPHYRFRLKEPPNCDEEEIEMSGLQATFHLRCYLIKLGKMQKGESN